MPPFTGYHPMGYAPGQPTPRPTHTPDASEITAGQRLQAIRAKASHIAPDGLYCYRWRYGVVEQAQWYTDHYGSYWQIGELMPPDVIQIKAGL